MLKAALIAGLRPDQFWGLTFREFNMVVEADADRSARWLEVVAWHAANIMNLWSKKKVTVKKLLGRSEGPKYQSKAEFAEDMRKRRAREEEAD